MATPQAFCLPYDVVVRSLRTSTVHNFGTRGGAASTDRAHPGLLCRILPAGILEPAPGLITRRRHHAPKLQARHPRKGTVERWRRDNTEGARQEKDASWITSHLSSLVDQLR
jgi:hypothetical protein